MIPSMIRATSWAQKARQGHVPPESAHRQIEFEMLEPSEQVDICCAMRQFAHKDLSLEAGGWRPAWILRKPRSIILLAEIGQSRDRVILKRQRVQTNADADQARQAAARESQSGLRAQGRIASAEGCSTPRILAHYEKLRIQIYTYVSGPSLQSVMLHTGRHLGAGSQQTFDLVARAAKALSSYQESDQDEKGQLDLSAFTSRLARDWSVFRACNPAMAGPIKVEKILEWSQEQWQRRSPADGASVYCHGDYGPGNMIVANDGNLVIIDFASGRVGSRLTDACYFLHQLWYLLFNPLMRREFVAHATRAFVESYGGDELSDGALCRLERACNYTASLRRFVSQDQRRSFLSSLHDRWVTAACARSLRMLLLGGGH